MPCSAIPPGQPARSPGAGGLPRTGWVELHVHDNGGGIEPLLLERIFEPFFTTKAEGKGTGLGLSVSHDLVRNMGGSLTAANQGEGALFVVRLPLAAPAEAGG